MLVFFKRHPDKLIYFQGSDAVRTRFYRVLINRELEQAKEQFAIYGKKETNEYETFALNHPYIGFAFELKS